MHSLNGKTVLITGASSGIGAACAHAFASLDARLLLAARRLERLEKLAAELYAQHGVEVRTLLLDVRDQPAVEAAINSLPAAWAAIDILVNNAGLSLSLIHISEPTRPY